jgi:opacity protein-like surface antigen
MSGAAVLGPCLRSAVAGWLILLGVANAASAQAFVSPFIGFNFGGDSGCPEVTTCDDKNLNLGVSVGSLGNFIGTELEFAYAKDFFGDIPGLSSNVLTLMGNIMLAPRFGPAQPYALVGVGLIKTHADLNATDLLDTDNNHFGWDVGGGLIAFFSQNIGVRGEIRYFHAFQDLEGIVTLAPFGEATKLDFGRAAAGLIFRF